MKIENNKFYITKSELEDLQKIVSMLCSPDNEQFKLGYSLYLETVPEEIKVWFTKFNSSISYVSSDQNNIRIPPLEWVICE